MPNRFARVILGVTCSPSLLNEAIRKDTKNYEFEINFVNIILDCFYVDDFTGGFPKALDLFKKLKLKFLDGHFHLRKWRINDPKLRKIISENTSTSLQPEKIIGILWEEISEMLVFYFSEICEPVKLSILQSEMYLKPLQCFTILLAFYNLFLLSKETRYTLSEDIETQPSYLYIWR